MPYLLRSDGVDDVVSLPSGSTSNVGTTAYTWWIKGTLRAAPSGLAGILGTSSVSASSGFATNATLQLRVYSAGTNRYGTGDNFFEVGVYHHYRLEHDAGGAWRAYRDDMVTPVASGTFTGSFTFATLNQMFRSSNASAMWLSWDMEEMGITSTTFSETYQADLSGGSGSILPTVSGNNQGTLTNFTVPDCWIFYSAGSSWSGTIGKTSLTVTTKSLFTALGYQTNVGLLDLITNNKQQNVSTGYNNTIVKTTDDLLLKQLFRQTGNVLGLNKYTEDVSYKQLSVQAGTSVSFTGLLNKQNYPVTYKQLSNRLGWSASSQKQTLLLNSKQESIRTGFVVEQSKQSLTLAGEQLSVTAGTSVSFVGTLSKQNYLLSQKALGSSLGAVITVPKANLPISFKPLSKLDTLSLTIGKSSLSLTGKALGLINGHLLEAQKRTLNLVVKQLSLGEVVYPIVPVERLFTIEHKNNIYIFKQNINVHIMKGK